MKKLLTVITVVFLFLVSFTLVSAEEAPTKYKLYVRQGCQYCAKVKSFINTNNLGNQIEEIETFNNEEKQKELEALFKKYNTSAEQTGVPFMVISDTEFLVGDKPIIDFLAERNNIEVKEDEYQTSTSDTIFLLIGGGVIFAVLGYGLYSVFSKK